MVLFPTLQFLIVVQLVGKPQATECQRIEMRLTLRPSLRG
jgi:hypothetical protein